MQHFVEAAVDAQKDACGPRNEAVTGSASLPVQYLHLTGVVTSAGPWELGRVRLRIRDVQGWQLGM